MIKPGVAKRHLYVGNSAYVYTTYAHLRFNGQCIYFGSVERNQSTVRGNLSGCEV